MTGAFEKARAAAREKLGMGFDEDHEPDAALNENGPDKNAIDDKISRSSTDDDDDDDDDRPDVGGPGAALGSGVAEALTGSGNVTPAADQEGDT